MTFNLIRFEDKDRYMAEVQVKCLHCKNPFRFLGLKAGLDLNGAATSTNRQELRIAVAPVGEEPNPTESDRRRHRVFHQIQQRGHPMKSLRQIGRDGTMREYCNYLGNAISAIMPSKDGTAGNLCNFVILFTDDTMQTQYVTDIKRAGPPAMLREFADILEQGKDKAR